MKTSILQLLTSFAVAAIACSPQRENPTVKAPEDIPVGVYLSLTGSEATFGSETLDGIRMAAEEINAAGGLLGRKVRLVVEDDRGKPEEAASVVTKMITSDRVIGMIGENKSACSLAAAPICQSSKVPMISPSSTNPEVTRKGDYIFRVCFIDSFQGSAIATFASATLKARRAAVLKDVKSDYSVGLAQFFGEAFRKRGGTIAAEQSYSEGDTDFRSQLTAIKAANPDVVMIPGYYTDVAQIAIQARDMGLTVPLLGGDGWDSPKLLEIGGANLNNSYYATPVFFTAQGTGAMSKFIGAFRKRFGKEPAALNAEGYDALQLFADGVRRAGSLETPKIREAIAATKNFPGAAGVLSIGPDRDPIKPVAMVRITNGKLEFSGEVTP